MRARPPVPKTLLPVKSEWDGERQRTFMLSDHPTVILQEVCYQIESYWGPAFVADYLRTVANGFDARQAEFAANQQENAA